MAKPRRRTRRRSTKDTTAFSAVRQYWWILVFVLLLLHVLVYAAFTVYQRNEIHEQLIQAAKQVNGSEGDRYFKEERENGRPPAGGKISEDVVVLRGPSEEQGFRRTHLGDDDYVEYAGANNVHVAISTRELEEQQHKVLLVLAVLYIGELLILLGWWSFVQRKIKEVFTVR